MGVASLEVKLFEGEVGLYNAGGLDTSSQHILLCGYVTLLRYPLEIVQITVEDNNIEMSIKL